MTPRSTSTARLRAGTLWLLTTSAALAVAPSVASAAHRIGAVTGPTATFDGALVAVSACGALVAGLGLWLSVTTTVVEVLRSPGDAVAAARAGRRAGMVRRAVLLACGLAVLSGPTIVAAEPAEPGGPAATDLSGLPLPDRPTGTGRHHPPATVEAVPHETDRDDERVVLVRSGDSLWRIASTRLRPGAEAPRVASYVARLHRSNADRIGADPDLIRPGQRLRLPPADGPPSP